MSSEDRADSSPRQKKPIARFATFLLLAICIIGGIFLFRNVRNINLQSSCQTRLSTLGEAIHKYHESHNAFPPAAGPIIPNDASSNALSEVELVSDADAPTEANKWSWRVRILPFFDEEELYDKFQFNEPWDSEHNLTVAETMPLLFQCPAEESGTKEINGQAVPVTSYVMVSGPKTIGSTDGRIVCFEDVLDGLNNTLLFVEVIGKYRPAWTEPTDITLEELARGLKADSGMSVDSRHPGKPGGANICLADCSTWLIESDLFEGNELSKYYNNIGELFVTLAIYDNDYIPALPYGPDEEPQQEELID